jgi:hypothetical protein
MLPDRDDLGHDGEMDAPEFAFAAEVVEWRGPAPFVFAAVPREDSEDLKEAGRHLLYWGQLPVSARVGDTEFGTAMWERDGRYLLPLRLTVQRDEGIEIGQVLDVALRLGKD